jgi:hypothetical protein
MLFDVNLREPTTRSRRRSRSVTERFSSAEALYTSWLSFGRRAEFTRAGLCMLRLLLTEIMTSRVTSPKLLCPIVWLKVKGEPLGCYKFMNSPLFQESKTKLCDNSLLNNLYLHYLLYRA